MYQQFLTQTLNKASQIANQKFGKVLGTTKPDNTVLTKADLEIGKMIIGQINKFYPDHNIIDEEAGVIDKGSDFTWVIDPIDGTSNYAVGLPQYGIMLGLLFKTTPIAGGTALPFYQEIYIAEKSQGAYCNNKKIKVSLETNLRLVLIAYHIDPQPEQPELTRKECALLAELVLATRNLRGYGSVFDSMMLARGKYGGLFNRSSKIWDNVAQQLIIEEAGGIYTDFFGKQMNYSNPLTKTKNNFTLCAAPPALHKQLQKIIHKES